MKKKLTALLVAFAMIGASNMDMVSAYAMDMSSHTMPMKSDVTTQVNVERMISQYDSLHISTPSQATDKRFTNDMLEKQLENQNELTANINKAKENGEKLYSFDEIANANAAEFGISEADFTAIKESILIEKTENNSIIEAFKAAGQSDHPIVQNIVENENLKLPASVIYSDHSNDKQDGQISGGGWPYCLDDNGFGPSSFITSDCYKAIVNSLVCGFDSTLGKMNSSLRYCKAYQRNCSPLINHSSYWHEHKWWEKIP